MQRRVFVLLALVVALMAPAPLALASGPSVLVSATTTSDRYRPQVVFEYATPVSITDPVTQVSLHKVGSTVQVPVTVIGTSTRLPTLCSDTWTGSVFATGLVYSNTTCGR